MSALQKADASAEYTWEDLAPPTQAEPTQHAPRRSGCGAPLLLLAVGVGAAWHVHRMQKTVSTGLRANVSGMRAAEELEILVWQIRTQLDHFLITGERVVEPTLQPEGVHFSELPPLIIENSTWGPRRATILRFVSPVQAQEKIVTLFRRRLGADGEG